VVIYFDIECRRRHDISVVGVSLLTLIVVSPVKFADMDVRVVLSRTRTGKRRRHVRCNHDAGIRLVGTGLFRDDFVTLNPARCTVAVVVAQVLAIQHDVVGPADAVDADPAVPVAVAVRIWIRGVRPEFLYASIGDWYAPDFLPVGQSVAVGVSVPRVGAVLDLFTVVQSLVSSNLAVYCRESRPTSCVPSVGQHEVEVVGSIREFDIFD